MASIGDLKVRIIYPGGKRWKWRLLRFIARILGVNLKGQLEWVTKQQKEDL